VEVDERVGAKLLQASQPASPVEPVIGPKVHRPQIVARRQFPIPDLARDTEIAAGQRTYPGEQASPPQDRVIAEFAALADKLVDGSEVRQAESSGLGHLGPVRGKNTP
jgi:hypothetical protein